MADNVAITAGSGTTIGADEVTDGTLGTVKVQYVKLMDGTLDGTTKAAVGANGLACDVKAAVITSGTISTITNVVHVDDNSGSLTVDGTVTANQGTANTTPWNENLKQVGGTAVSVNTGTMDAGTQRVAIASDCAILLNGADSTVSGTFGATGNGTQLGIAGYYGAGFTITGGATATVVAEISADGGTTWTGTQIYNPGTQTVVASVSTVGSGNYQILEIGGMSHVRLRCSAYTSGTVSYIVRATIGQTFVDSSLASSVNVQQVAGTTTDTNSGSKSAGTIRVVLATDQPALTNKLLVTPDANSTVVASGDVASGGADSGNPIKIGGLARTSPPTAVSNAQRVNGQFDIYGKQIVRESLREDLGNQETTITSSTAETTIVTADATYKLDVYCLVITNSSATGTKVTIKDSTAGTTRLVFWIPATETRGFSVSPSGGHKQNAANNNWTATCGTSVASIDIAALWTRSL